MIPDLVQGFQDPEHGKRRHSVNLSITDDDLPGWLEGLVLTHSQFSSYEPELFPGLIYRMVKPRIVLLIFVSGKVGVLLLG